MTDTFVVCVSDPELPATVSMNVEGVTEGARLKVSEEAVLSPGGVTGFGLNVADTPLGAPEVLRATAAEKPLTELTVTNGEAVSPVPIVIGEMVPRAKSGGLDGARTVRNLNM